MKGETPITATARRSVSSSADASSDRARMNADSTMSTAPGTEDEGSARRSRAAMSSSTSVAISSVDSRATCPILRPARMAALRRPSRWTSASL